MWTYPFKIKNENRIKASKKKNAKVRILKKNFNEEVLLYHHNITVLT